MVNLANTEVGSAFVSVYPNTKNFSKGVSDAVQTGIGKIAIGTMVGNMLSGAVNAVQNSMGDAINRLDTLNNFPRLMESIGFTASDAEKQIQNIMDSLIGLPATTQDVVALTQAFADSTGSLDLAANGALALTDAMIAAGVAQYDQTQLMRIFDRAIGSGTVTAQQWLAIQGRIPAATSAAARMLLGEAASSEDLGKAIQDGTVSMEDFLKTMVELDKKGDGNGFAALNEQAHIAAGGVGNAITILGQTVSNQMANIMNEIGQSNLAAPFQFFTGVLKDVGGDIVEGIKWIKTNFGEEIQGISEVASAALDAVGGVFSGAWEGIKQALADAMPGILEGIKGAFEMIPGIVAAVAPVLSEIGKYLGMALDYFIQHPELASIIIGVAVGLKSFQVLSGIAGMATAAATALFTMFSVLAANPIVAVIALIAGLVSGLVFFFTQTEAGKEIVQGFCDAVSGFFEGIGQWADTISDKLVEFTHNAQEQWQQFLNDLAAFGSGIADSVTNFLSSVMENIKGAAEGIAGAFENVKNTVSNIWNGIKNTVSNAANNIKNTVQNVFNGVKSAVSNVWNGIKQAISNAIEGAKEAVRTAIDKIKGFFNFSWSLPSIKLPHISIEGKFSLDPPSVPHFAINWYKTGGFFDRATLFGAGEAGGEVLMPVERKRYMRPFAQAVAANMGGAGTTNNYDIHLDYDAGASPNQMAIDLARAVRVYEMARGA